jgi:WD40 repeat protein
VLTGHEAPLNSASFSPDGRRIVTASDDRTARVWNSDGSGTPVTLAGHSEKVLSAAFSPDGTLVATDSVDGTTRVWRVANPGIAVVLDGHDPRRFPTQFSPDGSHIVSAIKSNRARIWDISRLYGPPRTALWKVAFCHTPDARMELFGEPEYLAIENHQRCAELTSYCSTQPYSACHERVTELFSAR